MEVRDIKRLPRWAQHEIERLRYNVADLDAKLAKAIGTEETRVVVNPYSSHLGREHQCFLGERETVRFRFGQHGFIDVRLDNDAVSVMGDGQITVAPHASNVVYVRRAYD